MKKSLVRILALAMLSVACLGTLGAETFSFAITDIEGLESLQREFGPFKEKLESLTGYTIKFFPVGSRTAAVEALKSKKIDFVLTGPAEYVIFKTLANPKIVANFSRPDYYTVIAVLADNGYDSLLDLKGKKMALGDIGSTSKHLAPLQLLKEAGLDPLKDVERIHTSVKLGWEALKRGDVAAFATTSDKFISLRALETSLEPGAVRVLSRGGDLPNDVLIAGSHVSDRVVEKLRETLVTNSLALTSEIVKGNDNKKYTGMRFIGRVEDKSYNSVRAMYMSAGYPQFSTFIE
jgi:phosphonate transport system substrate-binding protein